MGSIYGLFLEQSLAPMPGIAHQGESPAFFSWLCCQGIVNVNSGLAFARFKQKGYQ
ncbi:hypothetical protein RBA71_06060 [Brenneria goodwinii]|uniref:hypothetical protein n=1 Tax=Brenneria goodwinii TaxID=1109412 RepID=UPI0036ED5F73